MNGEERYSLTVPWDIVLKAADGDYEACQMISQEEAQQLVAEADLAERLNNSCAGI